MLERNPTLHRSCAPALALTVWSSLALALPGCGDNKGPILDPGLTVASVSAGDRAEHRKFKVTGDVISVDGSKAVLLVSGRKMTVDVRDLIPKVSAKPAAPTRTRAMQRTDDTVVVSAELNLIGQRVDDALDESDRFLDRALLEGKQAVRIIHGFGTGTLRKAIRDHLRKHPAVKSWRPGEENEGGDGATVAVLDT